MSADNGYRGLASSRPQVPLWMCIGWAMSSGVPLIRTYMKISSVPGAPCRMVAVPFSPEPFWATILNWVGASADAATDKNASESANAAMYTFMHGGTTPGTIPSDARIELG